MAQKAVQAGVGLSSLTWVSSDTRCLLEHLAEIQILREFALFLWHSPHFSSFQDMYVAINFSSRTVVLIVHKLAARASKSACKVLPQATAHRNRIGTRPPSEPEAADRDHDPELLPLLHILATMGIRYCLAAGRQYSPVQLFQPLAKILEEPGWHQYLFCCPTQLHPHRWSSHPTRGRGAL